VKREVERKEAGGRGKERRKGKRDDYREEI
jgi:hypothetical protein